MFWRRTQIVALLFSSLFACQLSQAQLKNWDGPNFGLWSGPFNWSPNGSPTPGDTVFIGITAGSEGSNVQLTTNEQVQDLEIRNGSDLYLFDPGGFLQVVDTTRIGGEFDGLPSRLRISSGPGIHVQTDQLIIESNGRLENIESDIDIADQMLIEPGGEVWSGGEFIFSDNSGRALNNNGILGLSSAGLLSLQQQGIARIDLDGTSGTGVLQLTDLGGTAGSFNLNVHGTELFDDFSGTINMVTGSSLTMVLDNEWVADSNSFIHIQSQDSITGDRARIAGTDFRLEGTILITDGLNNLGEPIEIDSNLTVANGAIIELQQNTFLHVFDPTIIDGGTFITASDSSADGLITLGGATSWQGVNHILGTLVQADNATVDIPAVINAETIDLDGNGSTVWDINSALTINASSIDDGNNVFNGWIYLDSSLSTLTVNLDSGETWNMEGEIIMSNSFPFPTTKLSGSPVEFGDEVFVLSSGVRIEADATFNSNSYIEFANPSASLVFNGRSAIHQAADFDGSGTLVNGSAGEMWLGDGFFQNQVAVVNEGEFQIAEGPGLAAVPEFTNTDSGYFRVEIGGSIAGSEFDFLTVTDVMATLDGRIGVKLVNGYEPSIGEEFTVLSAPAGIVGQFTNAPVSLANGTGYVWEILHNPFDVTVRLNSTISDVILGDVNQDGMVNLLDVTPFVDAIGGPYNIRADLNCDGVVDLLDVTPMIALLQA